METQKIASFLSISENEHSKFITKNGTSLTVKQPVLIQKINQ